MNNLRRIAVLTGFAFFTMAILAAFSFVYAYPIFFDSINTAKASIVQNMVFYYLMLFGIYCIILLDFYVASTLFKFFKNDNYFFAKLSMKFRIYYTCIFLIATFFLINNITENSNTTILKNYRLFDITWQIGLLVFGVHLLLISHLMKLHKVIPKILYYLTFTAGISYILVNILKLLSLNSFHILLNNILALPMVLGELGLASWLIYKGGKINKATYQV
jgi:hypothetical protein